MVEPFYSVWMSVYSGIVLIVYEFYVTGSLHLSLPCALFATKMTTNCQGHSP